MCYFAFDFPGCTLVIGMVRDVSLRVALLLNLLFVSGFLVFKFVLGLVDVGGCWDVLCA